MFSKESVIDAVNLSKRYEIYDIPRDRLKQMVMPRLFNALAQIGFARGSTRQTVQYFREFWALHDVSFTVKQGETVGIIGLNGSGKSTLLQIICSTLAATSGDVRVKGRVAALLELGSGFNPEFTGRENIFLNGQILGMTREEIQDKYDTIAEFADIGDFIDQPVKTYSSGMVVRLSFAVAINVEPDILVIDEALAVGDLGFQVRCFSKIAELQKRGATFLFVSHSPAAITQLCERSIVLSRGKLILDCDSYQAIRAYTRLCNTSDIDTEEKELSAWYRKSQKEYEQEKNKKTIAPLKRSNSSSQKENTPIFKPLFDGSLAQSIKAEYTCADGALISEVVLLTNDGESVNVIPEGQNLNLNFKVKFERNIKCCRFAWTLCSIHGTILAGGSNHAPGDGTSYNKGEEISVSSQFNNCFLPNDYLISIAVRGDGKNNNEYLCLLTNSIIYRSVLATKIMRNGVVNCLLRDGFSVTDNRSTVVYT